MQINLHVCVCDSCVCVRERCMRLCMCVFDNMRVLLNSNCMDFRLKLILYKEIENIAVFSSKFSAGCWPAAFPGWPACAKCWGAPWLERWARGLRTLAQGLRTPGNLNIFDRKTIKNNCRRCKHPTP